MTSLPGIRHRNALDDRGVVREEHVRPGRRIGLFEPDRRKPLEEATGSGRVVCGLKRNPIRLRLDSPGYQVLKRRGKEAHENQDEQCKRNSARLVEAAPRPRCERQNESDWESEETEPKNAFPDVVARQMSELMGEHHPYLPGTEA